MDFREINADDIERMNITDNAKHLYKDYFWQLIEQNNKFKNYTHPKKIQTLVTGVSEEWITLRDVFKKFPQLFMDVCDEIPKRDKNKHFLKDIAIPLHKPFPNASRSTPRVSFMTSMYRRFTRRRPASNVNAGVTNEQYRNWYIKTSVDCIIADSHLLRFIDKSVLVDKDFAKEAFHKKFDVTAGDKEIRNLSLANSEMIERIHQKYEDMNDVEEVSVFLDNYLSLMLRDKRSLRIASKKHVTGRKTKNYHKRPNMIIQSYLGGSKA